MKPNLIIFDKENLNNEYATFEKKLKPRIKYSNNLTIDECKKMTKVKENVMKEIEDIIFGEDLDKENEDTNASDKENFPNWRVMTGNYYVQSESYNKDNRGYQIIICIRMTCLKEEKEKDYFGIDFSVEFDSLDEKPEIEILGTSVL